MGIKKGRQEDNPRGGEGNHGANAMDALIPLPAEIKRMFF